MRLPAVALLLILPAAAALADAPKASILDLPESALRSPSGASSDAICRNEGGLVARNIEARRVAALQARGKAPKQGSHEALSASSCGAPVATR